MLQLSEKYKDFIKTNSRVDILEGTTAAGKTTVGVVKFMLEVAKSEKREHIISGNDIGVVEKNIINSDLGILDIFGNLVQYNSRGQGKHTMSHILFHTSIGDKIIYILGYNDENRWKKALGGQYGCIFIDEINTAKINFVSQVLMRCDYLQATLNPDNPDLEIYKKVINRSRPIEKYKNDAPIEILRMLDEPAEDGWNWWFFSFEHNPWVTSEKLEKIKAAHAAGTADYKHYILGLRGKATGIIFSNFDRKIHCITKENAKMLTQHKNKNDEHFITFTAGMDTSYSSKSSDTIAMSFLGITNKNNLYLLDELVLNNRDQHMPFAPSDIALKFYDFLEKNRAEWGFARDTFIDSADQATITELKKFKLKRGCIYNFIGAYKKTKIIDRIKLQLGWFAQKRMFIVEDCSEYIKELNVYSWKEGLKIEPEDSNDHMINSVQYAWLPYKNQIGL